MDPVPVLTVAFRMLPVFAVGNNWAKSCERKIAHALILQCPACSTFLPVASVPFHRAFKRSPEHTTKLLLTKSLESHELVS